MNGIAAKAPRGPFHGAIQIIRYNWPWYALGLGMTVTALTVIAGGNLTGPTRLSLMTAVVIADFWLISSVIVSHWIYDRSRIADGEWMTGMLPAECIVLANFHAGLDETSDLITRHHSAARLHQYDFYAASAMSAPSIGRARELQNESSSTPVQYDKLPLAAGSLDAAFVVFSAHELRRPEHRLSFFRELHRCLRHQGHLIAVEHLRDSWNFFVFGPGAFHFLPRSQWLSAFSSAGFMIQKAFRVTPFVTVYHLRSDS